MASDVFFADQICYINYINRSHAVCFGLLNAKKIFERTFRFRYRSQLQQEANKVTAALTGGKHITDQDFPRSPYQMTSLQERLIDCFLIGTFFEIAATSFLLDVGFVVHKLRGGNNNNIRRLAQQQNTTPVKIAELLQYDQFQDYRGNGRNGLESLRFETLDYSWLYANDYERELGFDQAFCSLGRYYRIERNMIHFPLAGASEKQIDNPESANVNGLDHIAVITDFIDKSLVPLFEKRKQQYNFTFFSIS
jgi:hypothetical protein